MFKRQPFWLGLVLAGLAVLLAGQPAKMLAGDISPAGERLTQVLDSCNVEKLWLAGTRVDWRSGKPLNDKVYPKSHTHCSAFAAAAAEKLGVYVLRPPEHSAILLANAQQEWLVEHGASNGWSQVNSPLIAQQLANAGKLVLVTFKTADPKMPGHIAIVRPSTKSDQAILTEGPQIIQAGASNYNSTNVREGFKHHPGAFEKNELLYFVHDLPMLTAPASHVAGDLSNPAHKSGAPELGQ